MHAISLFFSLSPSLSLSFSQSFRLIIKKLETIYPSLKEAMLKLDFCSWKSQLFCLNLCYYSVEGRVKGEKEKIYSFYLLEEQNQVNGKVLNLRKFILQKCQRQLVLVFDNKADIIIRFAAVLIIEFDSTNSKLVDKNILE